MPDDDKQTKIQRCREIVEQLGQADLVTACIFVLPGQERYIKGDPKKVLRNAFARTGRVVQFINPENDINRNKIENAVYDLYRCNLAEFPKETATLGVYALCWYAFMYTSSWNFE